MTCYVYRPIANLWLGEDEKTWTATLYCAAAFTTRLLAEQIAERELGPGHDAYVLDDEDPANLTLPRSLPGPTRYVVTEGNAWALRPGTDLLITCPVNADGSITWDTDETAEVDEQLDGDPASAAMAVRSALLVLGDPTPEQPRLLRKMLSPIWQELLDDDILDMNEADGCAVDCLRVMRLADTLIAACNDLGHDEKAAIEQAAAHQCEVFYYG